jgi:D-alanyl-lipoteichoic acid acyltransferase DltB (MBOAT superfamily)
MLFNSFGFLGFLAAVSVAFYALPRRWRWLLLLAASYYFYALWHFQNLAYLLAATLSAYGCGRLIAHSPRAGVRKAALAAGLLFNLGLLVVVKYYDFAAGQAEWGLRAGGLLGPETELPRLGLTPPVGLSFYAFSVVTYLVDAYRGHLAGETDLGRFALYVAYFPKIFAGPIERARTFLPQVALAPGPDAQRIVAGLQLIGWGLCKKVVIADNLAPLVDRAFNRPLYAPPIDLVLGVYLFAFQIYCDFSGYSDIAIGASRLLGFDLQDNFRRPYLARSTAEFWGQRWHISLASWFRDYLYIPMGGSRAGWPRRYFNVMAVFMVSGLWHAGLGYGVGWSFLLWGALNGAYQWVGLATAPLWRRGAAALPRVAASGAWHVARVVFTFHLIVFAWIFFRADSIGSALTILRRIGGALGRLPMMARLYPFGAEHYLAAALIALLIALEVLDERRPLTERLAAAPVALRWAVYYAAIFALLVLGRWHAQQFIYMQF